MKIKISFIFLTLIIFLLTFSFSFAQTYFEQFYKRLVPSKVFPSAKWVWYLVSGGVDWKDENNNLIMSKAEVEEWMGKHTDWLIDGTPSSNSLKTNPNLRGSYYFEFFNIKIGPWQTRHAQMFKRTSDNKWVDGEGILLEKYFFSKNQNINDIEIPFFHLAEDYKRFFNGTNWGIYRRLNEDGFQLGWKFDQNNNRRGPFWIPSTCRPTSDQNLLRDVNSYTVFGRFFPFDRFYIEWKNPPLLATYTLEYVSETTTTVDNLEIPYKWQPLEIIYDETDNFKKDGLVIFKPPLPWKEWKRAVPVDDPGWSAKYFFIRLRTLSSPTNTPQVKCLWTSRIYDFYPYLDAKNNELFLGYKKPFSNVKLYLEFPSSTPSSPLSYTLEYPSLTTATEGFNIATSWSPLENITDNTTGLTQNGTISFNLPADWKESTFSNETKGYMPQRYWIRFKLTATPTSPVIVKKVEILNERELYPQEIYSTYYQNIIHGWDERNDRDSNGYVDDNEFLNLVNPSSTARYKFQSRFVSYGWSGAIDFRLNFNIEDIKDIYANFYKDNFVTSTMTALYSDSMIISNPLGNTSGMKLLEPQEHILNWELKWNEFHAYLKEKLKDYFLIGGNPAAEQPYAPHSGSRRMLDTGFYTHKYLDYLNHEGWPHGWGQTRRSSFSNRILNFAQETGNNILQTIQFNMQWNGLYNIGGSTTSEGWKRFLEHSLAFFYLFQHPELSFMTIWTGVWYGASIIDSPLGRMPNIMAYQPTNMLKVDIGVPTNRIPYGYKPLVFTYDNKVVGDSTLNRLNDAHPQLAGRPIYPTNIFIFAEGKTPNVTTTDNYTIFAREYTKGLVLLKMNDNVGPPYTSTSSATFHYLPGYYHRVNFDGTLSEATNTISLKGFEGAILVKATSNIETPPSNLKIFLYPHSTLGNYTIFRLRITNQNSSTVLNQKLTLPLSNNYQILPYSIRILSPNKDKVSIFSVSNRLNLTIFRLDPSERVIIEFKVYSKM